MEKVVSTYFNNNKINEESCEHADKVRRKVNEVKRELSKRSWLLGDSHNNIKKSEADGDYESAQECHHSEYQKQVHDNIKKGSYRNIGKQ